MSEKINIELGHVQKTLFLPLWGRAVETQKESPLLVDTTAERIIKQVDFDFSSITQNISPLSQAAWIMRSRIVDEAVKQYLQIDPQATIVNIGCGLDTTFERVDNGSLLWYDLDLPDVIELRRKFIQEGERRKFIASSFLDITWFKEIQPTRRLFLIAAGVLYYFKEGEIKEFFKKVADIFSGSEIIFDICSPYGMKMANKRVIKSSGLDEASYLTWGLRHDGDILKWDPRFKILATRYYFKDPNLPASIRRVGWLSDRLRIQYILHLQLGGK